MKAKSSAAPAKNAARNQAASPQAQHLVKTHAAVKSLVESPGRPLDPKIQDTMQSRFGYDFSSVRVHADDKASESARMLGAHAYTTGNHIAFGNGKYAPHANGGRDLIAHELTHVVQQAHGPVEGTAHGNLSISHPNDSHERAAAGRASRRNGSQRLVNPLLPLPSHTIASGNVPVQRRGGLSSILAFAGAAAGVAGAALSKSPAKSDIIGAEFLKGVSSLGAPFKGKSAAAATGIKVTQNKFPTSDISDITAEEYTRDNVQAYEFKILELRTDDKLTNVAPFVLRFTTFKHKKIISATLDNPGLRGYPGGSGSSAEVSFTYTKLKSANIDFPSNPPPITAADQESWISSVANGILSPPAPERKIKDVDAVLVEISGANSFSRHRPKQPFSGSVVIDAAGSAPIANVFKAAQIGDDLFSTFETKGNVHHKPWNIYRWGGKKERAVNDVYPHDSCIYVNYGMKSPRVHALFEHASNGEADTPKEKAGQSDEGK